MSIKRFSFFLVIAFTSIVPFSCKKDNAIIFSFEGKVVEQGSGSPLSGVTVFINQQLILNNTTAEGFTNGGSMETDANGEYAIEFDRKKVSEFELRFQKEDYFPIREIVGSANVRTGSGNKFDQVMEPICWIEFTFLNNDPNADDHLRFVTHNFREGCEECLENTTTDYFGGLDTVMRVPTTSNEYVKFTIINVGTGFSKTDSIYTTPFATIPYTYVY